MKAPLYIAVYGGWLKEKTAPVKSGFLLYVSPTLFSHTREVHATFHVANNEDNDTSSDVCGNLLRA